MKLALVTSLATFTALLGAVSPALGVPPKGTLVVERAAAALPPAGWAEAAYLEVGSPGHPSRLGLRVSLSPAGVIRQDIQDLGPRGTLSSQVWAPVGAAPAGAELLDDAPGWLQLLSGRPLAAVLRAKGVDATVTSFAHDGPTILWVLGAGPHAPEAPQIHVERDSGRLRRFTERVLGPAPVDGAPRAEHVIHVRLSGKAAEEGAEAAWPARVEVEAGGRTVTFALSALTLGEPLAPERFRLEAPDDTVPVPDAPASPEA
ncbi:MAG: hypothetical protein EP329_12400, partial [Deltaproteobacteria bacterium]